MIPNCAHSRATSADAKPKRLGVTAAGQPDDLEMAACSALHVDYWSTSKIQIPTPGVNRTAVAVVEPVPKIAAAYAVPVGTVVTTVEPAATIRSAVDSPELPAEAVQLEELQNTMNAGSDVELSICTWRLVGEPVTLASTMLLLVPDAAIQEVFASG